MRKINLMTAVLLSFLLTSCAALDTPNTPAKKTTSPKDPTTVSLYSHEPTHHSYKILGQAHVSQYNHGGIKRAQAMIHDTLRKLAASIGGDALMNVTHNKHDTTATIITFDEVTKEKRRVLANKLHGADKQA